MLVPKHRNSSVVFQTFLYSLCICVLSYNPDTGTIYRRGVQARADFENILMGRQTSLSPAVRARYYMYTSCQSLAKGRRERVARGTGTVLKLCDYCLLLCRITHGPNTPGGGRRTIFSCSVVASGK